MEAGHILSALLSAAVVNNVTKRHFGRRGLTSPYSLQSIIKGSQGKSSIQELKAEAGFGLLRNLPGIPSAIFTQT